MLIPGGHKSNVMWDDVAEMQPADRHSMDGVPGAIEIHMAAGDVLLFVDCLTHGSARRINPGVRRTVWYRYTMAWSRMRFGYHPSAELCERLERSASPRRAAIVDPHWGRRLEGGPQLQHRGHLDARYRPPVRQVLPGHRLVRRLSWTSTIHRG